MDIELTKGQEDGLKLAMRLARSAQDGAPQTGTICGYAGTGKTTLLQFVLKELETNGGTPVLLSPTGKAASRITEITGYGAATIHRWIYESEVDEDTGVFNFKKKELKDIKRPLCGLIVVDEASMIGPDVWDDLQDTASGLGCSVLLIGDGFQLPPVQARGEEPFTTMEESFVKPGNWIQLTEILRQAADNPIIRITMALRDGDPYEAMADLDVVLPCDLDEALVNTDMRICRSNKMRHLLNARTRQLLGFKGALQPGEPLLVLKNTYPLDVYNGETHLYQGTTDGLGFADVYDSWTKEKAKVKMDIGIVANKNVILAQEALDGSLDGKIGAHVLEKACRWWQDEGRGFFLHANHGYVLTAHKSQGSEANRVLVCFEKGINLSRLDDRRWTYTALTRGKKRVCVAHV